MRPIRIPAFIRQYTGTPDEQLPEKAASGSLAILKERVPEVSIVIPAYNEENNIVPTLASLYQNNTRYSVEVIVVDNNSEDKTAELAMTCGATCIFQPQQGITFARNMGLSHANGKFILNADADTIYPPDWIELMVSPLENDKVCLTYGRFSTIPTAGTGRLVYFFYEYLSDISRWINKRTKDEAVNVYGFNSGFRKADGLEVEGFNHPPGTNEDGWLALKLRDGGYGKLYKVADPAALVWTTDRRIQMDGGLVKGSFQRIKRTLFRK